jgi:hypothetical protein
VLGWYSIYQHVRLRSDDCGIDEPKEEEAANERAYRRVRSIGVFPLPLSAMVLDETNELTLVKLLICLQIHLIPYGTLSMLSIIVLRKVLAISMSIVRRGTMMAWTSALLAAASGATPRGSDAGRAPVSSSIWSTICSYT